MIKRIKAKNIKKLNINFFLIYYYNRYIWSDFNKKNKKFEFMII